MKNLLASKENVNDSPPTDILTKKIKKGEYEHTAVKCKLITILKNKQWLPEIKNTVNNINMIKT